MEYRVEIHPEDEAMWDEMWDRLGNLAGLTHREANIVGDVVRLDVASHFTHERSPEGVPWEALAPMTQNERRAGIDHRGVPFRVAPQHPILVRTSDLKRSLTDRDHPRHINEVHASFAHTFISIGAADDPETPGRIATLHAGGVATSWVAGENRAIEHVVPARPFIGLSNAGVKQVDQAATRVLDARLERI